MVGGLPNERLCMVKENYWQVYYSERGLKTGLREFQTESEACEYFLEKMKRYLKKRNNINYLELYIICFGNGELIEIILLFSPNMMMESRGFKYRFLNLYIKKTWLMKLINMLNRKGLFNLNQYGTTIRV